VPPLANGFIPGRRQETGKTLTWASPWIQGAGYPDARATCQKLAETCLAADQADGDQLYSGRRNRVVIMVISGR
jgi:hypothetical protein